MQPKRSFLTISLPVILAALLSSFQASAQFFSDGNEPLRVKFRHITTADYDIIYPHGCDSLALSYAKTLERFKLPTASTSGYLPNSAETKPFPVIIHPYMDLSNGSVAWTPHRMQLYTSASAYNPESMSWRSQLCVHEGRHISQMQFASSGPFSILRILAGELAPTAISTLYCGPAFHEGDAVVAETALSSSGRGRSSRFLEYLRASFEAGDTRDYYQWRYGSLTMHTPDYYKVGYITQAGLRAVYDNPYFVSDYHNNIFLSGGFAFDNWEKTVRQTSGKSFRETFSQIADSLATFWKEDTESRGPFMPAEQITSGNSYCEYTRMTAAANALYAVRKGDRMSSEIVKIFRNKVVTRVCPVSPEGSNLAFCAATGRVYFSEYQSDRRWEMVSTSDIHFINAEGKVKTLAKGKYYNPSAHNSEPLLAVSEYPYTGSTRVVVMDALDGRVLERYSMPDGVQALQPVWLSDELYVSVVSDEGYGIMKARSGEYVLDPRPAVEISEFRSDLFPGTLTFVSDLGGVPELYSFDPSSAVIVKLTNLPRGGYSFNIMGGMLYFTQLTTASRELYCTDISNLVREPVLWSERYEYPFADKLSSQEVFKYNSELEVEVSEPQEYNRIRNAFKLHSWLPVYANYDRLQDLTFENVLTDVSIGATVFSQNDLGTLSGYAAVSYDRFHASATYTGLYPVFEADMHYQDAQFLGTLRTYVPLNFNYSGYLRGLVPEVQFTTAGIYTASLRGYSMLRSAPSCLYPKWGAGFQVGFNGILSRVYPFIGVYGYLPGLGSLHGVRMQAVVNTLQAAAQFTAQYAMPMCGIDWSGLSPYVYIKNMEIIPSYQNTFVWDPEDLSQHLDLHTLALQMNVVLGNVLWAQYPTRIGIKANWNINYAKLPFTIEPVFTIDF